MYSPAVKCYYKIQMPVVMVIYHITLSLLIPQSRIGAINKNNFEENKAWHQKGYVIKYKHNFVTTWHNHQVIYFLILLFTPSSKFLWSPIKIPVSTGQRVWRSRWGRFKDKKQTFLCQVAHSQMDRSVLMIISSIQKSDITVLRPCF